MVADVILGGELRGATPIDGFTSRRVSCSIPFMS